MLLSLRERLPLEHKLSRSQSLRCEPKVGSIVIVKNGNVPRGGWKLGNILRLIPSRDSRIRSAEIQLGQSVISRPINHLYPLELPTSSLSESWTHQRQLIFIQEGRQTLMRELLKMVLTEVMMGMITDVGKHC